MLCEHIGPAFESIASRDERTLEPEPAVFVSVPVILTKTDHTHTYFEFETDAGEINLIML